MSKAKPECTEDQRIPELAEALKVLCDPNRLRIICFLSGGERCVCEVERRLGISQQLTSHHLSVLREAGFLKVRKEGTWSYYSVDGERLRRVNEIFLHYLDHGKVEEARATGCCSG